MYWSVMLYLLYIVTWQNFDQDIWRQFWVDESMHTHTHTRAQIYSCFAFGTRAGPGNMTGSMYALQILLKHTYSLIAIAECSIDVDPCDIVERRNG